MGIIMLRWGRSSALLPDEIVIHEQNSFRAISSATFPSYRIAFNIPLICSISLLVTDRRCLLLAQMFCCLGQEISMWYPGRNPPEDPETIVGLCSTKGLFGQCLEIRSHNPTRRQRWLWSPGLTLRFFLSQPEFIEAKIRAQMGTRGM